MEISNLLPKDQPPNPDSKKYFAIEIGSESVKTATWDVAGVKPNLIATGTIEEYSPDKPEELITAVDTSLGKASANIKPEPDEVVFSLPGSWVENDSISADKKAILKDLTEKLELKPIGFVVTIEAIVHYLKQKSGGPFTGILVGVNDQEVTITIVSNSNILGSNTVGRSSDLGTDVEEGLARFSDLDSLPSNMTLYDGHTDLETEKQQLSSYNWQEKLPFLHIPKIDAFSPDETIKAVVTAGGSEVIESITSVKDTPIEPDPEPDSSSASTPKEDLSQEIPDLSEEFGFSDKLPTSHPEPVINHPNQPDVQPDSLSDPQPPPTQKPRLPRPSLPLALLFQKLSPPKIALPFRSKKAPPAFVLGIIALVIIILGLFAAYWYLPSATVTIYVTPRIIQRELSFTIDPDLDEPDLDSATIPGRLADAQVEGEATSQVSGEKLIGDQATGDIILYNRTDSVKNFPAGTKLTGPDSLAYTLDSEVQIASASSKENPDFSITTEPAQEKVSITAATIGAEFNLGIGTELSIANLAKSSFVAKADTDISGGTSRQITAVSEEDHDNLRDQLILELQDKIADQFNQSPQDFIGAIIIDDEETSTQLTEDFSADVGDEANELTLKASLQAQALTYSKSDLSLIIEKDILDSIPNNYSFEREQSSIQVIETSSGSDSAIKVVANINAKLIPELDKNEITRNIRGRYPEVTQDYFSSLPNFAKVAIDLRPKLLPTKLKTFPRVMGKITIEVEVQEEED